MLERQAAGTWGSTTNKRGNSVALNRDRLGHYLAGTSYPTPENLQRLADALGIPAESLAIERSEKKSAPQGSSFAKNTSVRHAAQASGLFLTTMPLAHLDLARIQLDRMVSPEVAVTIQQLILEDDRCRAGELNEDKPEPGDIIKGGIA